MNATQTVFQLQSSETPEQDVLAIDVGYGYTKAVAANGQKVKFPSVVSPAWDLPLGDIAKKDMPGYHVKIRKATGNGGLNEEEKWFVGELALVEGQEVQYTLEKIKYNHPSHHVLLLTAAALVGQWQRSPMPLDASSSPVLVVGLPVDYYRDREHRDGLVKNIESLKAMVSVNDGDPVWVTFNQGSVLVYPQGAGALLTVEKLPPDGIVALVDVGYKTTDCVALEKENGRQRIVHSMCHSCDKGIHSLLEAVDEEFYKLKRTQLPLQHRMDALSKGYIWFQGEKIELAAAIQKAKQEVARAIADQVLAKWGARSDYVRQAYLSGGGAKELPELESMFSASTFIEKPQWANAEGFLKAGQEVKAAMR